MGKKNKNQQRKRQQRARNRREQKRKQRKGQGPDLEVAPGWVPAELTPPQPERCLPPVWVDAGGHVVEDPRAVLGLPDGEVGADDIKKAYRSALIERPPEHDPEGARRAREARDRLLDPSQVVLREMGVLRVPSAEAWGLNGATSTEQERLEAEARLKGQAVLYALVEEAIAPS